MRSGFILLGPAMISITALGCTLDETTGEVNTDENESTVGRRPPPADTFLSFAVMNNSEADHRGVSVIALKFDDTTSDENTLVSSKTQTPPTIDGVDGGSNEWGSSEEEVSFDAGSNALIGIESARLRSLYTDDHIYFFASWTETATNDKTVGASTARKSYTFDGAAWSRTENEDRAVFIFPINDDGFSTGGCSSACHATNMAAPTGKAWDVWHWKATRSGPSRTLDDKWWDDGDGEDDGRHSDQGVSSYWEPGSSTAPAWMPGTYAAGSGEAHAGPVWAWEVVPFDPNAGWVSGDGFPGSMARLPQGSRADVTAVGKWDGTDTWTLEIKRARLTGNGDDRQF